MSKRKLERLIKKWEKATKKEKLKALKIAEKQAKEEARLVATTGKAAKLGIKVYAGATGAIVAKGAVAGAGAAAASAATAATAATATAATAAAGTTAVAAGGAGGVGAILGGTAVAVPPFSTALAVVAGVGLAAWGGVQAAKADREKWLKGDAKLLRKEIAKYKKKSSKWRRKRITKFLREYDKHLSNGNKKTISLIDGDKRNKEEANWRAKKAKLEIRLKALYAAQYAKSYKKLIKDIKAKKKPKRPKISKRQAAAEKRIVKRIKRKQANSIDPRTSPFPLLAPGVVGITPKLATADALQSRVSDVGIIKLAKMNPSPSAFKQISQSHDQAVALMKAPEKDLPKELQQPKKDNKALIIGVSAVSALLVVGGAVILARK